MSVLNFWKLESIGNDFPLVFIPDVAKEIPLSDLAIDMCDRRFGVGGDGLLAIEKLNESQLLLRMFNPDGSEDFCGNGIRCAAHFVFCQGMFSERFEISHGGQWVTIEIEGSYIKSRIGSATYEPSHVPLQAGEAERFNSVVFESAEETVIGSALSTGSTHVIIPVDRLPDDEEFLRVSPLIENYCLYPIRTSVIWREKVSADRIRIRIWERGVGETFGCGTGSSAAVMDLFRSEDRGGKVQVENPGGTVTVQAERWNSPITVEGMAKIVYRGSYLLQ